MADGLTWPWCKRSFRPRRRQTGGSPQRFCSHRCREAFHSALNRWALSKLEAGWVDLDALRRGPGGSINAAHKSDQVLPGSRDSPQPCCASWGPADARPALTASIPWPGSVVVDQVEAGGGDEGDDGEGGGG
jgi:hypothetical protein